MRPDCIVVPAPTLDNDLGLAQCLEDLAAEELVARYTAGDYASSYHAKNDNQGY